jgi:dipeptidyl aminopeptidase/acylaminoacyl peptidase
VVKCFVIALLFFAFASALPAELPPLIPREILFGNPERSAPKLSPDGNQIAWLAPDKAGLLNVWVAKFPNGDAHPITKESGRAIHAYDWAGDGKHILYLQDEAGNEIDHLFSVDLSNGTSRNLTPFPGVRAQNVLTDPQHPQAVLVALNRRDRHAFDMYRVDLETGEVTLEAENPGDVLTWKTDKDFVIRGATAFTGKTANTIIRVRDAVDQPWRDLISMPFERALFGGQVVGGSLIAGFDRDGKTLVIHSALHSDKGRLVRVDLHSGNEIGIVAEDPQSDVDEDAGGEGPNVIWNSKTHEIEAVAFDYTAPHWVFVDPKLRNDFEQIGREVPGFLQLVSRDSADKKFIVAAIRSDAPPSYYSFDRETKKVTALFSDNAALARTSLPAKKTTIITARDGLQLVSYLTTPLGLEPKNLPLVLLIHGGPWFRDRIYYDPEVQLLANRGYAVLQVNYRGSTGYGLAFLNAGTHQWGLGTQEDLYDAMKWTIDQSIVDPKRIAAMGWSGGGFATLRALEMRPDLFACGVDGVGPSDIATLFRSFPPYWSNITARWRLRAGDADHDEEWNRRISPLYHVEAIRAPLLIGQGKNDPRVTIANTEMLVKALRAAKRDVVYVVYPDEGHGFSRPENNFDFYGRVEEFLARHLGGRAQPWKKITGTTAEVR